MLASVSAVALAGLATIRYHRFRLSVSGRACRVLFWTAFAKSPVVSLLGLIHEKAPGLMIGLMELGASTFLITAGGLRTYIGILLVLAGVLDVRSGVKHYTSL